jgi:DNA-binding LacI/PurR family transcriptional regulator
MPSVGKAPTIHDVAAALGMHKSTVSLALSGKGNVSAATRQKIVSVAREMGYEPNPLAQRLARGVSKSLVCLCSGILDLGLTTQKILLIQKSLTKHGLEVPIYTFADPVMHDGLSQAAQVRQVCRQQPRAIICAGQMLGNAVFRELEAYMREGGIVVSYDMPVPLACDQVVFDREDNAYQTARYLIQYGHRDIGIGLSNLNRASLDEELSPQALRLRGFRRALSEANLTIRDEWLFLNPTYEHGGIEMARQFLHLTQRPTGLCIVNDYVALAFMVEVMRQGVRVPEDVSLVGHDNQLVASLCPVPLSSSTQPVEEISQAVSQMLLDRLGGDTSDPRTLIIKSSLVERKSVTAPGS